MVPNDFIPPKGSVKRAEQGLCDSIGNVWLQRRNKRVFMLSWHLIDSWRNLDFCFIQKMCSHSFVGIYLIGFKEKDASKNIQQMFQVRKDSYQILLRLA